MRFASGVIANIQFVRYTTNEGHWFVDTLGAFQIGDTIKIKKLHHD